MGCGLINGPINEVLGLCCAVSNEELRGATRERAAQVLQWVNFADSDIVPPASTWVFPTLGIMHYNKQVSAWDGPKTDLNGPKMGLNGPKTVLNGTKRALKWP